MHRRLLFSFLGVALLLAGCNKPPKSIADLKNATEADSMMYYFGEMQAANYWMDAETDTLLRTKEAREAFIRGFRDAMELDEDDSAYNKGLQLGIRLALRLREFNKRYDIKLSEKVLAASLEAHLESDTCVNIAEAQQGFYNIKDRYEFATAGKELTSAKKSLEIESRDKGFTEINDTLYAKDVTPRGSQPAFKFGDRLAVEITVSTVDGKEITTRQFPDSITLGEGRVPKVVQLGILSMSDGQTRQFMTTPRTLFGRRFANYNLLYNEPVIFTIKASLAQPPK